MNGYRFLDVAAACGRTHLPQDDFDTTVLRLTHACLRGHQRMGVTKALNGDFGLWHAMTNQLARHSTSATQR